MNGLGLLGEGGWLKIGTPGISQVLQRRLGRHARYLSGSQPILGRHARYAPGVKIGKSSSTLKPTHMLVAIHGANQWSDLNPWYGRTQSREVIAMCFTVDTHMDARNAILHLDFEKYFLFASSVCQQCQKRGQTLLNAINVDLSDIQITHYSKFFLNKGRILALWVMYTT